MNISMDKTDKRYTVKSLDKDFELHLSKKKKKKTLNTRLVMTSSYPQLIKSLNNDLSYPLSLLVVVHV